MAISVRPLGDDEPSLVRLVAERMRATLVEVLGSERGEAMYGLGWLEDRVRFHLDPARRAAVLLAEDGSGAIVGHCIVREEPDDDGPLGLVSTIYVAPTARRAGVATALLDRAEAWMRGAGLGRAATHTAVDNRPLHRLLVSRGYGLLPAGDEMVRLLRAL